LSTFQRKIKAVFGDPDPKSTADQEIRKLRQGSNDYAWYYNRFVTLITTLRWDDEAKISQFLSGLNGEIHKFLIGRSMPNKFEAFGQECIMLDNHLRAYKAKTVPKFQYKPQEKRHSNNNKDRNNGRNLNRYSNQNRPKRRPHGLYKEQDQGSNERHTQNNPTEEQKQLATHTTRYQHPWKTYK
jgi:hypothetical protein